MWGSEGGGSGHFAARPCIRLSARLSGRPAVRICLSVCLLVCVASRRTGRTSSTVHPFTYAEGEVRGGAYLFNL